MKEKTNAEVQTMVDGALDKAVKSDYDPLAGTPSQVATDLVDRDTGISDLVSGQYNGSTGLLLPYIQNWRDRHAKAA